MRHDEPVSAVHFSPDGRLLATSGTTPGRRPIWLWDASTGEQVSPPIRNGWPLVGTSWLENPRNGMVARQWSDGRILLRAFPIETRSIEDLLALSVLISGRKVTINAGGDAARPDDIRAACNRLPLDTAKPSTDISDSDREAWQRQQAFNRSAGGDWSAALPYLEPLLVKYPKDTELLSLRATAHAELGHWPAARRDFDAIVRIQPLDAQSKYRSALARLAQGEPEQFSAECRKWAASLKTSEDPGALRWFAAAITRVPGVLSQQEYSRVPVTEAAERATADQSLQLMAGLYAYRSGRLAEALKVLTTAFGECPTSSIAATTIAAILLDLPEPRRGN